MSGECLLAHAVPNVPEFGRGIAGARDEALVVGGQRQRHNVTRVPGERCALLARFNVPQRAAKMGQIQLILIETRS